MHQARSSELQTLFTAAEAAIRNAPVVNGPVGEAAGRIFAALRTPAVPSAATDAAQLPVCCHLPAALDYARQRAGVVADLADAFAAIEPRLQWQRRAGAATDDAAFADGHANAAIAGPEGLEIRHDLRIGVSLMAPQVRYPDHRHPPEEIYIALSDGEWHQAGRPWHAPGVGGLVHNPPNIVHAMRSADRPLLALWFLWMAPLH